MPEDLPDSAKSLIAGMQLCTSFMSSVMNNLLDVRKMEEGMLTLTKSPLSLSSTLSNVHKMLLPSVKPGVEFTAASDTRERDWVYGDEHRLQQVMTNVVTNAIKYTLTGTIKISIGWRGDLVRFECADTGPGIPKKEQQKLFERFVQRGGAPGTGLGLAIAKNIVKLAGGRIHFESDPSIKPGTTCVVQLPLLLCESKENPKPDNVPDEKLLEDELRFLIIDDVKMNRMMLSKRILKGIAPNATISEASTGEEALVICGNETFDVIVVDQFMEEAGGVMVGTDVVYAMRRMRIESIIIGCSGNDLSQEFTEAGADWVWQKPMPSNREIITHLRQAMEKNSRTRQGSTDA
jgi:CheY-like chemotaxis protein